MSQIPRFFYNGQLAVNTIVSLDEDTAKHIWQVLRMQSDDKVILTDGKGTVAELQYILLKDISAAFLLVKYQ